MVMRREKNLRPSFALPDRTQPIRRPLLKLKVRP
jgi:hypothetical protein